MLQGGSQEERFEDGARCGSQIGCFGGLHRGYLMPGVYIDTTPTAAVFRSAEDRADCAVVSAA